MAQQTATDDDAQLANELADLEIVSDASADEGEIHVAFNRDGIPESFNEKMFSNGYAVAIVGPISVTYRNTADF